MLGPPAIAHIDRLAKRVDLLSGVIRAAQSQLDQARIVLEAINRDIGRMAAPVPDGYIHAPGCVRGRDGWHTCLPIPGDERWDPFA
jgi:hypothetical protein